MKLSDLATPFGDGEEHTLLGWPKVTECVYCGKPSAILVSSISLADYECRGNPTDPKKSCYGDDRCGRSFVVRRSELE